MKKLYIHEDFRVDEEFLNAYRQISKPVVASSVDSSQVGPQGPPGPDGATTILSIEKVILQTDLDSAGKAQVGTMKGLSVITEIFGTEIQGFSDTASNQTFNLNDEDGLICSSGSLAPWVLPRRTWPIGSDFSLLSYIGQFSKTPRFLEFECPTCAVSGSRPGIFVATINYLLLEALTDVAF